MCKILKKNALKTGYDLETTQISNKGLPNLWRHIKRAYIRKQPLMFKREYKSVN